MSTKTLLTVGAVVEELGGKAALAEMTGLSPNAVWNWIDRGDFPSNTYVLITEALSAKGKTAPAGLWGMKTSEQEAAS